MNRLPPVTSSSTILVTATSPTRHFMTAVVLLHLQQFDVEDQGGIGRDRSAGAAGAIAELGRDVQRALAADPHPGHTLVPAGDDLLGAERELERLAAVDRAVELLALGAIVRQQSGVVHGNFVAGFSGGALAGLCVGVFQPIWHLGHLIVGCVRSPDGRRDSEDGERQSGACKSDRYHGFFEPAYATRSTAPFLDSAVGECNVGPSPLREAGDGA